MFEWLRAGEKKYRILTDQQSFYESWKNFFKKIFLFIFVFSVALSGVSMTFSPTDSMLSTLYGGDMLIIRSGVRPVNISLIKMLEVGIGNKKLSTKLEAQMVLAVKPGEVVAFNATNYNCIFCKRLIAKGCKVGIHAGIIQIDGKPVLMKYKGEFLTKQNGNITSGRLFERCINGVYHRVLFKDPFKLFENSMDFMPEMQLEKDHCFFLGDNFYGSADGRYLFGYQPQNNIIGSIIGITFQIQDFSANPFRLVGSINKKRIFQLINPGIK
jgi:signal peptidase I